MVSANGIGVGQNPWDEFIFAGGPGTYQPDWAHIIVRNNDIECGTYRDEEGNFNYTMGINIWNLNGVEVKKNKIKGGEENDVGVGSLISIDTAMNVFVKKNVLSGTCQYCLEAWNPSENIHVVNNDLREVILVEPFEPRPWGGSVSLNFGRNTKKCFAVNNKIGEPGISGGIRSIGEKNLIANNIFDGNYPGWTEGIGCVLLGSPSTHNKVVGVKLVGAPKVDMCDQVLDNGTNNRVVGCKE